MSMKAGEVSVMKFMEELTSSNPTPGGGGAAALVGAISASLGSMSANLTVGKKKYVEVEARLRGCIDQLVLLRDELLDLIDGDAEGFYPLSQAYGLPRGNEEEIRFRKEEIKRLEQEANAAPLRMIECCFEVVDVLEILVDLCSKLVISDIGCAAICARAAMEAASLNVIINHGMLPKEFEEYLEKAGGVFIKVRRML